MADQGGGTWGRLYQVSQERGSSHFTDGKGEMGSLSDTLSVTQRFKRCWDIRQAFPSGTKSPPLSCPLCARFTPCSAI